MVHDSTFNLVFKNMEQVEKEYILKALIESKWQVALAARLLGLGRATVYRRMKEYGLKRPEVNCD